MSHFWDVTGIYPAAINHGNGRTIHEWTIFHDYVQLPGSGGKLAACPGVVIYKQMKAVYGNDWRSTVKHWRTIVWGMDFHQPTECPVVAHDFLHLFWLPLPDLVV